VTLGYFCKVNLLPRKLNHPYIIGPIILLLLHPLPLRYRGK
jgi:hypothetical protein